MNEAGEVNQEILKLIETIKFAKSKDYNSKERQRSLEAEIDKLISNEKDG
jgi:hypothetical protein